MIAWKLKAPNRVGDQRIRYDFTGIPQAEVNSRMQFLRPWSRYRSRSQDVLPDHSDVRNRPKFQALVAAQNSAGLTLTAATRPARSFPVNTIFPGVSMSKHNGRLTDWVRSRRQFEIRLALLNARADASEAMKSSLRARIIELDDLIQASRRSSQRGSNLRAQEPGPSYSIRPTEMGI